MKQVAWYVVLRLVMFLKLFLILPPSFAHFVFVSWPALLQLPDYLNSYPVP